MITKIRQQSIHPAPARGPTALAKGVEDLLYIII